MRADRGLPLVVGFIRCRCWPRRGCAIRRAVRIPWDKSRPAADDRPTVARSGGTAKACGWGRTGRPNKTFPSVMRARPLRPGLVHR